MKIAITADAHLRSRSETPERYAALENIFEQSERENIEQVFILGDLFDRDFNNYHDFDRLCQVHQGLKITVLPGNHDSGLKGKFFTAENVRVIEEPRLEPVNEKLNFLFFPYDEALTLDEAIEVFMNKNGPPGRFVLFGHGDWLSGSRPSNTYEKGFYMPLSLRAVEKFSPLRIFLGHIHQADPKIDQSVVVYPGSPCGLEINETGPRRFLVYEPENNRLEKREVVTTVIYFKETLLALPVEDEISRLREMVKKMIEGWKVGEQDLEKVKLRLQVRGFTRDKGALAKFISEEIARHNISFYDEGGADFSELKIVSDESEARILLLKKIQERLQELDLSKFLASPGDVLEEAAEIIFGGK
ncbi:MAG: metallophosphoesterase family protein [Candidatus Saccharicenans sp.]